MLANLEILIHHVEAIEAVLADLPLVAALANDCKVDGASDAAAIAIRDLLDTISGAAIEHAVAEKG